MNRTVYFNKESQEFLENQNESWSKVVNEALKLYKETIELKGGPNGSTSQSD